MTNAEVIINMLSDIVEYNLEREVERISIDDGGALEESTVNYHIKCPSNGFCVGKTYDEITENLCIRCKYNWLLQEFE